VRGIVKVVTAVANGDLKPKLTVKSKGEVAALAETINDMTETLALFADQVTTVAREVGVEGRLGGQANVPGTAGTWKDLTGNVNLLAANLTTQVRAIAEVTTAVARGDLSRTIQVEARGEVAELKDYINTMIGNLRLTTQLNTEQDWLKTNLARFTSMLQGQRDVVTVSRKLLSELVPLINAHQGVIYQYDAANSELKLLATFAEDSSVRYPERLELGSSLIGQCAIEKQPRVLTDIPQPAGAIDAVVFKSPPRSVIVHPITFEDRIKAVISLSSLQNFEPAQLTFLEQLSVSIGVVLTSIEATMQTESLLMQSQQLAAELQDQQKAMQKTNEELAQKAQQLAERNVEVERKNEEIDQARRAVEEKAAELALTSRYKSEFLANMSHELRTPLNSILILGQQLSDNPDRNLTEKQVEFARTIHGAGTDLLNLISDILDLSKIESGTVSVDAEEVAFGGLIEAVARPFRHEAERRGLDFQVTFDADLGKTIFTDSKRLQQVLKNLLSNAFKFTREGHVRLSVKSALAKWSSDHPILSAAPTVVAFEVQDSGIGIPADKQKLIFEAFQQADASTSRKYGGTGLGLAISRELAHLLGGEIQLTSEPGAGSTFTLFLPLRYASLASEVRTKPEPSPAPSAALPHAGLLSTAIEDDRDGIIAGDQVLLIVEDDANFARILLDAAHEVGFKGIVCQRGIEAMVLATDYNPTAISLDIHLPDVLGWSVLSQLKHNPLTRHIPVQVLTLDDDRHHGLARGAYSILTKPLQADQLKNALRKIGAFSISTTKRLLIVEDDPAERLSISSLIEDGDVEIVTAPDGATAIDILKNEGIDCVVLDLKLPDMSGFDILEHMSQQDIMRDVPVVVFTGRELSSDENLQLRQYARTVVVKGVESPERLLDETALFLHRVVTDLPAQKQELLSRLHDTDDYLVGRKVLLVDDDARNIFALSSLLERRGMEVLTATTGLEAIQTLSTTDVSIVLMDIMMPEMDGYQTMQKIRSSEKNQRLPIIALTAKAMKGDREKCLEAGASDYLAKPVDTEQLLSALRMWLHR
jgi:signal transduction histidine kinase/DNA-binding response OmpR family regulator/HAMP domain-containing protein